MISRRKAISLLELGATLSFTLSSALAPVEAEAQEAAGTAVAPAEATGTHGMQRRAGAAHRSPSTTARAPHRSTCARHGRPGAIGGRLLVNA